MSTTESDPRESPEWNRIKEKVRRRDQYRCQRCRKHPGVWRGIDLHVHHILPVSRGGTNDMENLVTLCNRCHNRLHRYEDEHERLTLSVFDEHDTSTWPARAGRRDNYELNEREKELTELLKENGPMQLKDIMEEVGQARGTVYQRLDQLKISGHVVRVRRGVYGYVTKLGYWEAQSQFDDGEELATTRIMHPGEQITLEEVGDG